MKPTSTLRALLICFGSSLLSSLSANAAILYYDGGTVNIGGNGNSIATGLSGNWNTALLNWDAGSVPYVGWNNTNNDIAFFGAGNAFAAPTPGTVTLTSAITVGGLIFNTSGYTIAGSTLTFGGTDASVVLNNHPSNPSATISSAIGTSAANLTFTAQNPLGTSTLTFGAAGGWTGSTTVNNGFTLQLNSAATALLNTSAITLNGGIINQNATSNADRISNTAAITSYGGTISTNNTSGANVYNEVIGSADLVRGLTTFVHNTNQAGTGTQTLTLSGLTRTGSTNTSTVNFASASGLNGTKNFIAVTGSGTTTGGQIIGPWATTGNTSGANDYAVYSAGQVAPANMGGTGEGSWTVSTDAYNNNVVTQTLAATRTITALRNTAATATLTLATGANLETYGLLNGATTLFTVAATGTGSLTTPTGGGYLYLNSGNATTGGTITVSAPIINNGGTVSVVKSGLGTLNLTGANTFSGGITVNSGTVVVNNAANSFATGSAGADVINGGALTYSTLASMGGTGRDLTFNGTGTFTLSAGSYTGGTLTSNAGANAVINEAASGATISFATTTGAGNIIYTIGSTGSRALNLGNASTFTGNLQGRLTNNANQGTNNVITFSSIGDAAGSAIQFVGGTADGTQPFTIAFNGTSALTFNNRQIQMLERVAGNHAPSLNTLANNSTNAAHTWTINTDLLYTGGRANTFGAQGLRTFQLSGTNTGNNAFNGVIGDGQNQIGVTKIGAGKWILGGNNTYTGATSVSAGTFNIQHANALGSTAGGTTVANAATLQLQGGITTAAEALTLTPGGGGNAMLLNVSGNNIWSGSITANTATNTQVSRIQSDLDKLTMSGAVSLTGSNHQLVLQGAGDMEISGQITGVGRVTSSSTGAGVRTLSNDTNSYTGATAANGGILAFTSIGNVGATSSALGAPVLADSTIGIGGLAVTGTLRYTGTAIGGHTSDRVINLVGTTGGATIEANGTDALVLTATNTATGAGSKTFTLSGTNTDDNSIGAIVNNSVTNTTALTKSGAGKWILTGANSYTGATAVNGGTLLVNGSTSSTSAVTVGNTATLGGTGTIGGTVTVNSGGFLASGASIESLATGALTLNASSTFAYEMNKDVAASVAGDLTAVTGDLTLDLANAAILSLTELGTGSWSAGEKLTLISYSGAWNGGLFNYGGTLADDSTFTFSGMSWLFNYNDTVAGTNFTGDLTGSAFVTMTAVPEPRAALLGGLGLLALLRRRR